MIRFVPLGAATHLSYELRFVGGEYSFEDENTYWHTRQLRGEVVPVPRSRRQIGYDLIDYERKPGAHFRVARARIRAEQITGHEGGGIDDSS